MNIKFVKTGKTTDVNDCYAARLIEQGVAVPFTPPVMPEKIEKPKSGKKEKGE